MQIPGFELLEKLGEGGMATVWKARQISLDRIVAIKILSSGFSLDKADTEQFLREAQAMAALNHPGIIQVYDANVHEGMYYFVMEFVAGYSVGDWIRRKTRISEGDALLTADYVADALHYAWRTQRIVHCDIKPDNIMIDEDGTIKVADLGLSKSIGTPGSSEESDVVTGTPNFMSPEQIMGASDLDCRADIYSLGAMLYHMLTGKLLFQESGDDEVLKKQLEGHVPDLVDLNPTLSMGTCWMIEKMLAKDREHRHADWDAVLRDIPRVLKGKMPLGEELPEGVSTVTRSKKRNRLRGKRVERVGGDIRETRPLRTSTFAWMPVLATALVLAVVGGLVMWMKPWKIISFDTTPPPPEIQVAPVEDPMIARGAAAYKEASDWAGAHADDYDEAIRRFEKVAADYRQTRTYSMALSKIDQLRAAKARDVVDAVAALREKTDRLVQEERFEEAEALCREYTGRYVSETAEKRQQMGESIRQKLREFMAASEVTRKDKEKKSAELLVAATDKLIADGAGPARELMEQTMKEQGLDDIAQVVDTIHLLRKLDSINERLLLSFKTQEGRMISVALQSGNKTLKVVSVAGDKVRCEENVAKGNYSVKTSLDLDMGQLSAGEMISRLGQGSNEEVYFHQGILALKAKTFGAANKCFSKTSSALSPLLIRNTAELSAKVMKDAEEQVLVRLMKASGVNVPDKYDEQGWMTILAGAKLAGDPRVIEARVEAYRKERGSSVFARNAEPLLAMLVAKAKADAGKAIAVAMEQIDEEAIKKMLVMHNKGLDKANISITKSERYPGYCLRIMAADLVSIGVLRTCGNTITELDVSNSKVMDVGAISGTNIRSLDISNTKVASLPWLSSVPLERLIMRGVQVKDIGSLSRTKLKVLDISGTKITDLRPIQHLPLESLDINDMVAKAPDLSLLKGMPLERLSARNSSVSSIVSLQKLPLKSLDLSGNEAIRDLSLLAGMSLHSLSLDRTRLSDLGILKKMKLRSLSIAGTDVSDLRPLSGMELSYLDISKTRVNSLAPLQGMKLVDLRISNSRVSDLSPLTGMNLNRFHCAGIEPASWDPIIPMPITDIVVTMRIGEGPPWFVNSLKNLKVLNGMAVP